MAQERLSLWKPSSDSGFFSGVSNNNEFGAKQVIHLARLRDSNDLSLPGNIGNGVEPSGNATFGTTDVMSSAKNPLLEQDTEMVPSFSFSRWSAPPYCNPSDPTYL